jgi:putative ABC transport system substrate-binding protein
MTIFSATLTAKRLQLLHELVPDADPFGLLNEPAMSGAQAQLQELEAATRAVGKRLHVVNVTSESDLDGAFAKLAEATAGAVLVGGGALLNNRRAQIVALAARHGIPAIYENRESVAMGGLLSYGPNVPDVYRHIGVYAGRILKGEKPADLPFLQPAKFDMAINFKAAKALGLDIPPTLLARADEVIE